MKNTSLIRSHPPCNSIIQQLWNTTISFKVVWYRLKVWTELPSAPEQHAILNSCLRKLTNTIKTFSCSSMATINLNLKYLNFKFHNCAHAHNNKQNTVKKTINSSWKILDNTYIKGNVIHKRFKWQVWISLLQLSVVVLYVFCAE